MITCYLCSNQLSEAQIRDHFYMVRVQPGGDIQYAFLCDDCGRSYIDPCGIRPQLCEVRELEVTFP